MVDFIKGDISYMSEDDLRSNKKLKGLKGVANLITGEAEYPLKMKYGYLDIMMFNASYKEIRGSLHSHYNYKVSGSYRNYNQFQARHIQESISDLEKNIGIEAKKTILRRLEFGLNIPVNKNPQDIINNNIITHGFKPITKLDNSSYRKYYTEINFHDFDIKIYDKGAQYGLRYPLLRFEIKCKKSRNIIQRLGIKYMNDLPLKKTLRAMGSEIIREFNDLIIVDDFDPEEMDIPEVIIQKLQDVRNPREWAKKYHIMKPYQRVRYKKAVNKLLKSNGLLKTKKDLRKRFQAEIDMILHNSPVGNGGIINTKNIIL